jgi:hypothetical protein
MDDLTSRLAYSLRSYITYNASFVEDTVFTETVKSITDVGQLDKVLQDRELPLNEYLYGSISSKEYPVLYLKDELIEQRFLEVRDEAIQYITDAYQKQTQELFKQSRMLWHATLAPVLIDKIQYHERCAFRIRLQFILQKQLPSPILPEPDYASLLPEQLDEDSFYIMPPPPELESNTDAITFRCMFSGQDMLRISKEGFFVRGEKVEQDKDEAKIVYDAFLEWLSQVTEHALEEGLMQETVEE